MPSALWELQKALHAKLTADTQILSAIGAPRIWDHVPRGSSFPYVTIGATSDRDWSTGSEEGTEHIVTFHVWSRAPGRKETENIAASLRRSLHDQPLSLDGYHLVNIRHELTEIRRDTDGELYHGVLRFRATTEPLT
jgi:hypothetical protein